MFYISIKQKIKNPTGCRIPFFLWFSNMIRTTAVPLPRVFTDPRVPNPEAVKSVFYVKYARTFYLAVSPTEKNSVAFLALGFLCLRSFRVEWPEKIWLSKGDPPLSICLLSLAAQMGPKSKCVVLGWASQKHIFNRTACR